MQGYLREFGGFCLTGRVGEVAVSLFYGRVPGAMPKPKARAWTRRPENMPALRLRMAPGPENMPALRLGMAPGSYRPLRRVPGLAGGGDNSA